MAAPSSDSFYESLPVFDEFSGITDPARYRPLPDGWHVVVADVQGSTAAIARGLYKHVNVVGADGMHSQVRAAAPSRSSAPHAAAASVAQHAAPHVDVHRVDVDGEPRRTAFDDGREARTMGFTGGEKA